MFQLVRNYEPIEDSVGIRYRPRAYGDRQPDGSWEGWLVFFPFAKGAVVATDRETTQLSFADLVHWASTITPVYLEGALDRALQIRQQEPNFSARLAELALLDRRAAEDAAALESAAERARADAVAAVEETVLLQERVERSSDQTGEPGPHSHAADSRRRRRTTQRKKPR